MTESVALPLLRPDIRDALDEASSADDMKKVAATDPLCLQAWARLANLSYAEGDHIASYAYARVGYHRGLDLLRTAGWCPDVEVHWADESNRGFLRSLHGLMRAAAAIGEGAEARRCREFLLQLDPADHFNVGAISPRDLSRRLPD